MSFHILTTTMNATILWGAYPQQDLRWVGIPCSRRHYFQHFSLERRICDSCRNIVSLLSKTGEARSNQIHDEEQEQFKPGYVLEKYPKQR